MNPKYIMKAIEYARGGMFVKPELTREIASNISKDSRILVAFSYEMLPVLNKMGYKNVTLVVDKPRTSVYNIAKYYGYKTKAIKELKKMKFDVVIGNPPYGKNSNLAVKFLNEISKYSENIWMVLPRTFRKPSIINRIHKNLHMKKDVEVDDDTFPGTIITCYQHWIVNQKERSKIKTISKHKDFEFVDPKNADVCIGRVGRNRGGRIWMKKDFGNLSPNSHYFLKVRNKKVITKLKQLRSLFGTASAQTVANHSLSKNDLIRIYEESL